MAKRTVVAPFTLITHDAEQKFDVGDCIEGEVAAHWYAKHHSEEAPDDSDTQENPALDAAPQKPPTRRRG